MEAEGNATRAVLSKSTRDTKSLARTFCANTSKDFFTHSILPASSIEPLLSMTKAMFIGGSSSKERRRPWMPTRRSSVCPRPDSW